MNPRKMGVRILQVLSEAVFAVFVAVHPPIMAASFGAGEGAPEKFFPPLSFAPTWILLSIRAVAHFLINQPDASIT